MMSFSKTSQLQQLSPSKSVPNLSDIGIKLRKFNKNNKTSTMYFKDHRRVNMNDWQSAKMERENNLREFSQVEIEEPKFGAGSEFGKESKEDARKRKLGIIAKKYNSASQPWMMKIKGKMLGQTKKKFKSVKKGGIGENAGYYIFVRTSDKTVDGISLNDWFEFQQIQTYKALTAEEAEEEYNRRDRRINLFDLMVQKRLRNNDEEEDIQESAVKSTKKKNKQGSVFKISEMDEWVDSDDESDDSNFDENEDKKNNKESDGKKKKKKRDVAMEAFEESDDGDEEGRELDYISDSSASENELELQEEIKAVDEIESTSSDEELENNCNSDKSDDDDDDDENEDGGDKNKDLDDQSKEKKKEKNYQKPEATASSLKRSRNDDSLSEYVDAKKFKPEIIKSLSSSFASTSQGSGFTLEAVKRYLMRKPMTTSDLLQKFKSKKTGLSSKEMTLQLTKIMQTLKPSTKKVKDKVYFFLEGFHRQN